MKKVAIQERKEPFLGFTLIELLTVIAIIGILAAILIPVVASARQRAMVATCQSNLRQVGVAVYMYSLENDDYLPQTHQDPMRGTIRIWVGPTQFAGRLVAPPHGWANSDYLDNADVLICPGLRSNRQFQQATPGSFASEEGLRSPGDRIGYAWIYLPRPNNPELDNTKVREDNYNHVYVIDLDGRADYYDRGWVPHSPVLNALRIGGHVTSHRSEDFMQYGHWVDFTAALHRAR